MNTATVGITYHALKPLDVILQASRFYVVESVHHDAYQVTVEAKEIGGSTVRTAKWEIANDASDAFTRLVKGMIEDEYVNEEVTYWQKRFIEAATPSWVSA